MYRRECSHPAHMQCAGEPHLACARTLTNPDFSKMQVVKAYAHTVVALAIDYWRMMIDNKKGAEVARLKVARIFNPLHVLGNQISVADIDSFKIFRLSEHPLIRPHIEGMKLIRKKGPC